MKHELIERTAREWVHGNADRLPTVLGNSAFADVLHSAQSAEEIADALIRLAGRMEIAETRAW
jgi:hypothetical protein